MCVCVCVLSVCVLSVRDVCVMRDTALFHRGKGVWLTTGHVTSVGGEL